MTSAVIVSLRVKATPEFAFKTFTEKIGDWWQPDTLFRLTPRGDGKLHLAPGPEGRLFTVLPDGQEFEIGKILVWIPGKELKLTWRQATMPPEMTTEVRVLFDPVGQETRVTVEHRGWSNVPRAHAARHGFPLTEFQRRSGEHWQRQLHALAGEVL